MAYEDDSARPMSLSGEHTRYGDGYGNGNGYGYGDGYGDGDGYGLGGIL